MRSFAPLAAALLTLACSKPAATPAADTAMGSIKDTTAAMAPAAAAPAADAPVSAVVVLYNWPKDTAAFEKYYATTHVPLVGVKARKSDFPRPC